MPTIKTPHEFLVRWDDLGNLQGAHIVYRASFTDDAGVEQFSKFGDPQPVLLTDAALLGTIGAQINSAALADGVLKDGQIADANAARVAAEADRDTALAEKAAVAAQLAALQPVINGVPQVISFCQAKTFMQLYPVGDSDLWTTAVAAANAITDRVQQIKTLNLLLDSTEYHRQKPELVAFAATLGLDDAALDMMFTQAKLL